MKRTILSFVLAMISIVAFAQQKAPEWTSILSDKPETFSTQLISSSEKSIQVNVQVPGFYTTSVSTPKGEAKVVTLPKALSTAHAGEPDMPMTGIPVMIGDRARMDVRVIDAEYMDFEGIDIAPSKGDFSRQIDPETVPYTYGECYDKDEFFPAKNLDMYEPYIIRDFRGQNMAVYPFAYNPVTKTLRVYYNMTVEMYKVDDNGANAFTTRKGNTVKMDNDFKSIYQRHFINYEAASAKYTVLGEDGDLLIICYDNFITNMTDFVNWKKTRGINTTIVGKSTAGSTYSAIKSYIQSQYNANNNITHVLLVGDVGQIPGYSYSGGGSSYSGLGDNPYGQIVGSDVYNDVIIGRFSASSAAQVTTQVNRTITYEKELTTSATWCQNGLGISASAGNGGHYNEDDYQHIENLRTDLLNYGYSTVYQDYKSVSGYPSSTTTTISNHINSGVGIINYCNHGEETGWQSHYYMNSNVNALTNNNKLPFIFSVACLVGKYDYSSGDCFAETWMHATNSSNPTGAIGGAFSYISQPWIPPMWAQDEFVDILVESYSNNIKRTLGGAAINSMMAIFDNYSTSTSQAVGTYQAWIVYGDPTLMMRTKTPQAMTVNHSGSLPLGSSSYSLTVSNGSGAVATITDANHNILGKATVSSSGSATISISNSSSLTANQQLTLCVFGYNKVTYLGTITVVGGTKYTISASANPTAGGTVTGAGQYYESTECTLTATANEGYTFVKWTKNGAQVSTDATISFTVSGNASYVAVFSLNNYAIAAAAYPTAGGSVSGAGNYNHFTTATLTATANEGYTFVNWTLDGVEVSTNATYTFTVTGAGNYVANFTHNRYQVQAASGSVEGGTVVISGTDISQLAYNFEDGTSQGWTLLQGPDNDSPHNWMHSANYTAYDLSSGYGHNASNGFMLSESLINNSYGVHPDNYLVSPQVMLGGSINFWATNQDDEYGAEHFAVAVSTNGNTDVNDFTTVQEWTLPVVRTGGTRNVFDDVWYEYTVDLSAYSGMGYIAIRHFDCYEQWLLCVDDITIAEGYSFYHGEICNVTATANEGYEFVNWTENGDEVSTEASYTFTVTAGHNLVANFEEVQTAVTQTSELVTGLNWWTANVGTTLADLEAALGANGLKIMDGNGNYVTYNPVYGWGNNPNLVLVPGQMYKIQTSTACEIELTGEAINPSEVEITLHPGTNWIGFIGSAPVALSAALSNMTPTVGDVISGGGDMYARYTAYGWGGNLTYLVPGEGYIYNSKASTDVTFIYSVSKAFNGDTNGMDYEYRWTAPAPGLYADRNHVTAQVMIDGDMQTSVDIEVAAFIGDEVRGRVRLIDGYTYLTVFGNPEDVGQAVTFKAYDHATGAEYGICQLTVPFSGEEEMHYDGDAYMLRFSKDGNAGVEDIFAYQNGSDIVVNGEGTLQVYDVMGRFVGSYEINGVETIEALPMGVYIFRMTGETVKTQKIVVR